MKLPAQAKALVLGIAIAALCAGPLVAGDLTARFELTLERVLRGGPPHYTQDFLLADVIPRDVRRFTNFSGDLSGRYIGALASAAGRDPALTEKLAPFVEQVLLHQKNDGHFGDPMGVLETPDDDMARLWGNGRLLIGLLEYYRESRHAPALEAAKRLGDFLVEAAPRFNAPSLRRFFLDGKFAVGYVCWTQNIEGLAALYRHTADDRYLQLADQMAERTERRPSQHTHGFLSTLRGLVELARVSGQPRYLEQAEREWQSIVDSGNVLVHGAIPEAFLPSIERDEGCSQGDWIRLSLDLWRETGNITYLEQAEKTLFNEFALNQFASGDFGHINLRETGVGPEIARSWWCCTLHGLRTFPEIERAAFRLDDGTLYYDLPVDAIFKSTGLRVTAKSSLETDGRITVSIAEALDPAIRLAVRLPSWAKSIRVNIENEPQEVRVIDGYLRIQRAPRPGTEIHLSYDFITRLESRPDMPGYAAVFHGPWLLAVSESSSPEFFDEPYHFNRVLLPGSAEGPIELPAWADSEPTETPFLVPAAHLALEWIPAGYPEQRQTAQLRPLAEATASGHATRWEFQLPTADDVPDFARREVGQPKPESWIGRHGPTAAAVVLIIAAVALAILRRRRN